MINIHEGKVECDDHLQSCFHSLCIANQGLAIVLIHNIQLCTILKVLHTCRFGFWTNFERYRNLKKNNHELWNNEHRFGSKNTPNRIVHYSAIYCKIFSRMGFRLFEYSCTIKSVKFFSSRLVLSRPFNKEHWTCFLAAGQSTS